MKKAFILLALLTAALVSCKKGEPLANIAPETRISLSQINLDDSLRLTTEVELHWYGEDEDGYVTGYEISFDETSWTFVTVQDSTFSFDISGADTLDVQFWVRAIDNDQLADASPAYLSIPIQNSPPAATFDTVNVLNDTAYCLVTLLFDANDPDGNETLDSIFIKVNGGPWFGLAPTVNTVTLVPQTPLATGAVVCDVYTGLDPVLLSSAILGFVLEGNNEVYLQSRDIAGEYSPVDTSKVFYTKHKTSDLLVIDSHAGGGTPSPEEVYFPILTAVYGNYDYIDIQSNSGANIPALWNPTFGFYMNLYDKVFWYADGSLIDGELYLEAAAGVIQEYFNQGGKMLISATFPTGFDNASAIIGFSPMDSLSTSAGQARFPTDSLMIPVTAGYDTLQPSAFIGSADPFYISEAADTLYYGQVQRVSGWSGPAVVAARQEFSPGQIDQVFFSLELHKLNGRPTALQNFFSEVLLNEFNW